jgi:predicted small integral membrane protein
MAKRKMHLMRYIAISLMLYLTAFYALSVLGNITDYDFNLAFVKTLLSMHGVPAHAGVSWRAINSPVIQALVYWAVVAAETLIFLLSLWGAIDLWLACHKEKDEFNHAKSIALIALALGISLYFFGYLVIGDQWFRAWMGSGGENVEGLAFEFNTFFCLLFIIVRLTP